MAFRAAALADMPFSNQSAPARSSTRRYRSRFSFFDILGIWSTTLFLRFVHCCIDSDLLPLFPLPLGRGVFLGRMASGPACTGHEGATADERHTTDLVGVLHISSVPIDVHPNYKQITPANLHGPG